ncbi:YdcF family protein [Paractinoplanes lichenicola]|uniref:YdcF family protein n=1 Tax=Paractinoplanes lichenicola TaxID=2802976 RepID=A0ABS1VGD9_9ACTN|nr:YdcF family protein [Actinoplanes lichenicola]MBL7253772.1 YdcF family protein [Actinoplanes lichenicola]
MAADRVAAALLVLGNGLAAGELSPGSLARVRAAVAHPPVERIILAGGWEQARSGAPEPPEGCREGDLMRQVALDAGVDAGLLRMECRSRSTLENLLNVVADGLLDGLSLGPSRPLGLVTHAWHLPRARYLALKVLGLPPRALVDVPVPGRGSLVEQGLFTASRLWFFGVKDPAVLLRRERRMVTMLRRGV